MFILPKQDIEKQEKQHSQKCVNTPTKVKLQLLISIIQPQQEFYIQSIKNI